MTLSIITWIILIVFIIWLVWFVIRPYFKKQEYIIKDKLRDSQIKNIKRSIKAMNITKEDLFDD